MKSKILSALFVIICLIGIQAAFVSYRGWIVVHVTGSAEARLEYTDGFGKREIFPYRKADELGGIPFFVTKRKVTALKIDVRGQGSLKEVIFEGKEALSWKVDGKKFRISDVSLKGKISCEAKHIFLSLCLMILLICVNRKNDENDKPEKERPFKNIEALRFFFALMVVRHHLGERLHFWSGGWLCVEFFFIISGFFLTYSFKNESVSDFIKGKLIKFCPLLLFSTFICALLETEISFPKLFSECLFLSASGLYTGHGYNPPAWFVCVLFWVQLFCFYLIKTRKKENVNLIVGVLCFLSYAALVQGGIGAVFGELRGIGFMIPYAMVRGGAGICAGYLMAEFYRDSRDEERLSFASQQIFFTAFEILSLTGLCFAFFSQEFLLDKNIYAIIIFLCVFYCFIVQKGAISRFLNKNIFEKAGKYSFSIFLTHSFLMKILERLLPMHPDWPGEGRFFVCAVFLSASVLFGILSYHLVEKPSKKFFKKAIF